MKKTTATITRILMLMITFSAFHTFSAFASASIVGSLDVFNGSQISGWVYEQGNPLSLPDIQLKITDLATGEIVRELDTTPSAQRNDLLPFIGENVTPGFSASLDMNELRDGLYSATAYSKGIAFSEPLYYVKENKQVSQTDSLSNSLGTFRLTGYCSCSSCSGGWGSRTSSGAIAASDHTVAVDPRVIPLGSKLLINGAIYTAEDVGGAVKGNHIDIYFDSHAQARQFGSQQGSVYLLKLTSL